MLSPNPEPISPNPEDLLSPDAARQIILWHTQHDNTAQPDSNNHNTSIKEEWIIPDEILPDNRWNSAPKSKSKIQNKTQSHYTVQIAQQKQILKFTPPVNFQFLEKHQQKAYMAAARLAETLGYSNKTLPPLKLISTQEHIKYLQQLTPSKVSHNRTVTFYIEEEND